MKNYWRDEQQKHKSSDQRLQTEAEEQEGNSIMTVKEGEACETMDHRITQSQKDEEESSWEKVLDLLTKISVKL